MDEIARRQPGLTAALRMLAADEESTGVSADVQTRLLEEVRRLRHGRRRGLVTMSVLSATLSAAAAAVIWQVALRDPRSPSPPAPTSLSAARDGKIATEFFPLFYSTVPMSGGRLVRLEVPRQAAASSGVELPESAEASTSSVVLADVLVGEDGMARAVRFVGLQRGIAQKEQVR